MDVTFPGRYLADQLSAEERAEYEKYLCSHPEALAELEAIARLKLGLEKLQNAGELEALLPMARKSGGARRFFTAPMLAAAASIAAVAIGVTLWRSAAPDWAPLTPSLTELQQALRQPLAVGPRATIMRTRGAGDDATVTLPETEQAIELRVLPDVSAEPAGFRVELSRVELSRMGAEDQLELVARGESLHAGADGYVAVYADSATLSAGVYQLSLIPLAGDAIDFGAQVFRIRVQAR